MLKKNLPGAIAAAIVFGVSMPSMAAPSVDQSYMKGVANRIVDVIPIDMSDAMLAVTESGTYIISKNRGLIVAGGELIDYNRQLNVSEIALTEAMDKVSLNAELNKAIAIATTGSLSGDPKVLLERANQLPDQQEVNVTADKPVNTLEMQPSEKPDRVYKRTSDEVIVASEDPQKPSPASSVPSIKVDLTGSDAIIENSKIMKGAMKDEVSAKPASDLSDEEKMRAEIKTVHNDLLKNEMMVIYPSKGEVKNVVTVFTDITCPYCQKFHPQIEALNEAGVTVRYMPYPRGGLDSKAAADMAGAFCAGEPTKAFDKAFRLGGVYPEPAEVDCSPLFRFGYDIGQIIGIPGTPMIMTDKGDFIPGFKTAEQVLEILAQAKK